MLTGKLVRVRHVKNRLVPLYVDPADPFLLALAGQLIEVYRSGPGRTRGEIAAELADLIPEGPRGLVPAGLAKLLEDRCEFEVGADHPPEELRRVVFRLAARARAEAVRARRPFDRAAVLREAAAAVSLTLTPEQLDASLFADLKDEQRLRTFDDISPERLLHRYNVALAQAILLRSTALEVRLWGETPARFRQLFRAIKFHRLIGAIRQAPGGGYVLQLDGPLSLFSATNKYGLQLALFLPSLLHCRAFDLKAAVRWGTERKEKLFTLSSADGLRSHLPDFGVYTPPELQQFAASFAAQIPDWTIASDPHPIHLPDGVWVPDFQLTHTPTGKTVYVEVFGFWRKGDIERHRQRLGQAVPGQFVLCVPEAMRADEPADPQSRETEAEFGTGVYRYKRALLPEEVARAAAAVAGFLP